MLFLLPSPCLETLIGPINMFFQSLHVIGLSSEYKQRQMNGIIAPKKSHLFSLVSWLEGAAFSSALANDDPAIFSTIDCKCPAVSNSII